MDDKMMTWLQPVADMAVSVGVKLIGALVLWMVGRVLIGLARRMVTATMRQRELDPTLSRYLDSTLDVLLNLILVIAILGVFGVETTTFAGLLAAAGVAIGMAWSGLLSNFAAGAFLIILRPFKVGDFITAGGVTGDVMEIGLFVTTINTMDNIKTFVGNNTIFSGNIQNFTANPYRRVDRLAQLAHDVDHNDAIARLKTALAAIDNVETSPEPSVEIVDFTLAGPVLSVRPFCHNDHYWQVYFDTNKAIREVCGEAGYSVPEQHFHISQKPAEG